MPFGAFGNVYSTLSATADCPGKASSNTVPLPRPPPLVVPNRLPPANSSGPPGLAPSLPPVKL
jgi:hypothetical protein